MAKQQNTHKWFLNVLGTGMVALFGWFGYSFLENTKQLEKTVNAISKTAIKFEVVVQELKKDNSELQHESLRVRGTLLDHEKRILTLESTSEKKN